MKQEHQRQAGAAITPLGRCIQCGDALTALRPYIYQSDTFRRVYPSGQVLSCQSCGLVQADAATINETALTDYYRFAYRQEAQITSNVSAASQRYYQARARALRALAEKHLGSHTVGRIFEVGAGYGYNLAEMRAAHPHAQLLTDEIDENLKEAMGATHGTLDDGPYDIIIMSHVLEHFTNPGLWLERARDALAPEGLLLVEVPNDLNGVSSVTTCDEPHISFFTAETLRRRLETAGLQILETFTAGRRFEAPNTPASRLKRWLGKHARPVYATLTWLRSQQRAGQPPDFTTPNPGGIFLRAVAKRSS